MRAPAVHASAILGRGLWQGARLASCLLASGLLASSLLASGLLPGALDAEDSTATTLPKPDVPDPYGLGDRLALVDYLKTQLHVEVKPGASYDELVQQYWDIVNQPKQDADEAKAEKSQELRAKLQSEFAITTDETDPDKLQAMVDDAASKAMEHGADPQSPPAILADAPADAPPSASGSAAAVAPAPHQHHLPIDNGPADDPAAGTSPGLMTVNVPGAGRVDVSVPPDWRLVSSERDSGSAAPQLVLRSATGTTLLSVEFVAVNRSVLRSHSLDEAVSVMASKLVDDSLEGRVTIQTLVLGQGGEGRFAEFTDKAYSTAMPSPNGFRVAALGIITTGNVAGAFTLAGTGYGDPGYLAGKVILSSVVPQR
jgi:hypothetical protein